MTESVRYRVRCLDLHAHLYEVVCRIPQPAAGGQRLRLPAWIPGSYLVRDFARHIVALTAAGPQGAVAVNKLDKAAWQCAPCDGPLEVRAEIYAHDPSVREAWLDGQRAFFNGTSVLLEVEGHTEGPLELAIEPLPSRPRWRVFTSMQPVEVDPHGFGLYRSADYDELIDHPFTIGEATVLAFEAAGVGHRFAITGRHRVDGERLAQDLSRLCSWQIGFFGEAPMDRYLFLGQAEGEGYGGLEHRNSCALIFRRSDLPQPGRPRVDASYRRLLGLCSHEYFHCWNIKRIRPAAFTPYGLDAENYTRLLWVFEGITSYYQNLALLRCGLIEVSDYCELLGQTITRVQRGAGRTRQTLAESSFDAWIKLYKPDENSPNAVVSYYTKGALAALALDLTIRRDTQGRHSLDDVVRALWQRYGAAGDGVPEDGFEHLAQEVTGLDLDGFFTQAVRSTRDLPLEELLACVGVKLCWREASADQDAGGTPPAARAESPGPWLGASLRTVEGRVQLGGIPAGGPAERAGLSAGDELLAVDGLKATAQGLTTLLAQYRPGETVAVTVFRGDELLSRELTLQRRPCDTAYLVVDEEASPAVEQARRQWLGQEGPQPWGPPER